MIYIKNIYTIFNKEKSTINSNIYPKNILTLLKYNNFSNDFIMALLKLIIFIIISINSKSS